MLACQAFYAVLWIRIRMDPELFPGCGFGIIVPDPDPAKNEITETCEFWTVCTVLLKLRCFYLILISKFA